MSAWTTETRESVTQTSTLDNGYHIASSYDEIKMSGSSDISPIPTTGKGTILITIDRSDEISVDALDALFNAIESAVNSLPNPNA